MAEHQSVVTYLAYPNNPTGNLLDTVGVGAIICAACDPICQSLVIVDEVYQPFA